MKDRWDDLYQRQAIVIPGQCKDKVKDKDKVKNKDNEHDRGNHAGNDLGTTA